MSKNKEEILGCYISGNMSEEDKLAFEKEMSESTELTSLYADYKAVWQLTNQLNYSQEVTNASWDNFNKEVKEPLRILGLDWLKVAASITLLVAFSFGMWHLSSSSETSLASSEQIEKHLLEDKSEVLLNKNSTLTYSDDFNSSSREVWLKGEALFDVTKGKGKFIIHLASGDITVLGTQFSVFSNDNFSMIELYEGSITYSTSDKTYQLEPNERLTSYQNGEISISKIGTNTEWAETIVCNNTPLSYILGQLELSYDISINVRSKYLCEHYTVTMPKNNITKCIQILNQVSGHNFALIDKSIVLK